MLSDKVVFNQDIFYKVSILYKGSGFISSYPMVAPDICKNLLIRFGLEDREAKFIIPSEDMAATIDLTEIASIEFYPLTKNPSLQWMD